MIILLPKQLHYILQIVCPSYIFPMLPFFQIMAHDAIAQNLTKTHKHLTKSNAKTKQRAQNASKIWEAQACRVAAPLSQEALILIMY